jgi:ubiquinone/menaquinone biosynthesis C-methylase UbiE
MKQASAVGESRGGRPENTLAGELDPWEDAYLRFESRQEEINKFVKRLQRMGALRWPRESRVVELFCGRGNGLRALGALGFTNVEGIDLSASLLAKYGGPAQCLVADCRQLPYANQSKDIVVIQGGLHHLQLLPEDLNKTLFEVNRILREGGFVLIVEPWLTPFLSLTHVISGNPIARRLSKKIDALATMIRYERDTYEQWLRQPNVVLGLLDQYFKVERRRLGWGKLMFLGKKKTAPS